MIIAIKSSFGQHKKNYLIHEFRNFPHIAIIKKMCSISDEYYRHFLMAVVYFFLFSLMHGEL